MTALVGTFALSVGLFAAGLSGGLWVYAVRAKTVAARRGRVRLARQTSLLTVAGSLGAVVVMEWALVGDDFSLRYVAENSSRGTPLLYRVTALWSALDGSLLLWLLALSAYGVLVSRQASTAGTNRARIELTCAASAAVQAVTFAFFVVTVAATRPFAQLTPAVADGQGPNPLLADHPAMAIHPPLLYLGYAGLVVPFGYALAALATGQVGDAWMRNTRRWVLAAWVCLTSGIVLGAWWSYAVLGWGGYWAWDPVENASLLPWLTATALVHALLRRRAGASPVWGVALAAASFLLVCTGTFLTRSGVVLSVHSFTQSAVGPALLTVLVLAVAAVAGLLIWRSDRLALSMSPSEERDDAEGNAEGNAENATPVRSARGVALLLNNVLLVGLAVTVLAGTFLPVVAGVSGADVSVGAPYYDRIAVPVGLALLGLLVVGTVGRWRVEPAVDLGRRVAMPAAVSCVVIAALGLSGARGVAPVIALGMAAGVVAAAGREMVVLVRPRAGRTARPAGRGSSVRLRLLGGHLAHVGLAVVAAGIATSSAWADSAQTTVPVGGSVVVGDARAQLVRVDRHAGDDGMQTTAVVRLTAPGRISRLAAPALVYYPGRDQTVTTPDVASDWRGDLYLTLLGVAQDGSSATLRLADEPLVGWLWFGGALMAVGGIAATFTGRRRPAVVNRADRATSEQTEAERSLTGPVPPVAVPPGKDRR